MAFLTIKPIIPKDVFGDTKKITRAVETTFNNAARAVKADFGVTTRTWKNRPEFKIDKGPGFREVYTESEIYAYVDEGTPPHTIRPRPSNKYHRLFWNYPFRAKTRPGWIGSNKGRVGSNLAVARQVRHPGTKARNFTQTIYDKWDKELPVLLQRAINAEVE